MRPALAVMLVAALVSSQAEARPRSRRSVQHARIVAAATPVPQAPSPPSPSPAKLTDPEQLLAQAEKLFASLEYDQVLPLVRRLLAEPALTVELRVRALALEGSTLAVTSDVAEAERPFRKLLRLKPDFELPPKSPPKILAAFRKVQTEERLLADELEASRRQQQIARLKLLDEPPAAGRGGRPFALSLRVFDPDGSVGAVRVPYRKAGEATWQVLALQRDATGAWAGVVPGEVTANADAYSLELYVETVDAKGTRLLARGSDAEPVKVAMSAGSVRKLALPRPLFFATAGLTLAAWGAAGALGLQLRQTQLDTYGHTMPPGHMPMDVQAMTYKSLVSRGETLATATNAMLITAAVLTVTSVIFGLLVDWFD